MTEKRSGLPIKLFLLCVLAAGANFLLNTLSVYFIKIPLFLDTVFTAVVSFTAGVFPGIITALFSFTALCIRNGNFDPFILCAIAEVLLICGLKPKHPGKRHPGLPATVLNSFVSVFARLMVLYIVCTITISVLGGLIDFFYYTVWANPKLYFSAEDTFKMGLLRSGIPVLAMNIFSRIPVNMVDRFIVIFGGYFISRVIGKLMRRGDRKVTVTG